MPGRALGRTRGRRDRDEEPPGPTGARRTPPRSPPTRTGVRVAVLKGRQNYLCRNRAQSVGGGAQLSFDDGTDVPRGVADQMRRILRWANDTDDRRPRRAALRGRSARAARALGHPPGVPRGGRSVPRARTASAELAKDRASESLDPHRERPPLRVAPRVGIDAAARARVRRLRRGPRDPRHLRDAARNVAQRGATARPRRGGALTARARVRAKRCDDLLSSADRFAASLLDSVRAQRAHGTRRGLRARTAPAPTNSSPPSSRAFATLSTERRRTPSSERSAPSARPSTWPMISTRVSNVKDGELLFLSQRDREIDDRDLPGRRRPTAAPTISGAR